MFLLDLVGSSTKPHVHPPEAVEDALRGWDDVERGRNGPALLEVGNPQFASSKLPFYVCLFLLAK